MPVKKLNLGAGNDIKKDWVNLDSVKLAGIDVVHNLEKLPLPFGPAEFEEILANDVLEHVADFIPLMRELYRILKNGGEIIEVREDKSAEKWISYLYIATKQN